MTPYSRKSHKGRLPLLPLRLNSLHTELTASFLMILLTATDNSRPPTVVNLLADSPLSHRPQHNFTRNRDEYMILHYINFLFYSILLTQYAAVLGNNGPSVKLGQGTVAGPTVWNSLRPSFVVCPSVSVTLGAPSRRYYSRGICCDIATTDITIRTDKHFHAKCDKVVIT